MNIVRLSEEHYDELLQLLNCAFSKKNGKPCDFEKDIPKMWGRDDEHMGKHLGIFEDGKLVSCIGIYPYTVKIGGSELKFASTGNIATYPDYEGRGYMTALINAAMEEICSLGLDAIRLGGQRTRYNRFGFETAGQRLIFEFTVKSRLLSLYGDIGVVFKKIAPSDKEDIEYARELYNSCEISVYRDSESAYQTMTMWSCTPYIAYIGEERIAYLSAKPNEAFVAEIFAKDTDSLVKALCAWVKRCGVTVSVPYPAYRTEDLLMLSYCCDSIKITSPCMFRVMNFVSLTDALMKLKASYKKLPLGELLIDIEGYGKIRLYSDEGGVGCEHTDRECSLTLGPLEATRLLFGPTSPELVVRDVPEQASAWLPLPLSWNGQDRV